MTSCNKLHMKHYTPKHLAGTQVIHKRYCKTDKQIQVSSNIDLFLINLQSLILSDFEFSMPILTNPGIKSWNLHITVDLYCDV